MNKTEAKERIKRLFFEVYDGTDWYVEKFDLSIIKSCIESEVNINTYYTAWDFGRAPLFLLVLNGYELFSKPSFKELEKFFIYLLSKGADIHKNPEKTISTLGYAVKNGAFKSSELLFDKGVKGQNDSKNLLLLTVEHDYLYGDDREQLIIKLASLGFDGKVMTKGNYHNLMTLASYNNLVSAIKGLLKIGLDPNYTNKYNATALMYACGMPVNLNGHLVQHKGLEIVGVLLEYGADIYIKTTQRRGALSIAKSYEYHKEPIREKIIKLLESASKHITSTSNGTKTVG